VRIVPRATIAAIGTGISRVSKKLRFELDQGFPVAASNPSTRDAQSVRSPSGAVASRVRHEHAEHTGQVINHDLSGRSYFAQFDLGHACTLAPDARHAGVTTSNWFYYASTTLDVLHCFQVATIVCNSNCRADKTDFCLPEWVYGGDSGGGHQAAIMTMRNRGH